jgi:hypothetical protein
MTRDMRVPSFLHDRKQHGFRNGKDTPIMGNFTIGKRTERVIEGKYDEEVTALLEATTTDPDANLQIVVPTGDAETDEKTGTVSYPEVAKHIRYFQESAKHAAPTDKFPKGVTARVDGKPKDQGDGTTLVAFYLTDKIVRPRGKDGEEAATETASK